MTPQPAAHTPTPWKLKKQSDSPGDILDANGKDTATTNTPFLSDEQMEETAAFIVRACNHYEKMLKQLKTFRLLYEKEMGILNTQELDTLIAECEK